MRPRRNVFDPRGIPFVSSPPHPSLSVSTTPSLVVLVPSVEVFCPPCLSLSVFPTPSLVTSALSFSNPVPSLQPGYNQSVRVVRDNPPPTLLW